MDSIEEGPELRVEVETLKFRIVYESYTEKKHTPSRYVPGTGPYDYGYAVTTGEPATFSLTKEITVRDIVVEQYYIQDGCVVIAGDELGRETLLPLSRVLVIEPWDGPRTEPVEKGLRTFA